MRTDKDLGSLVFEGSSFDIGWVLRHTEEEFITAPGTEHLWPNMKIDDRPARLRELHKVATELHENDIEHVGSSTES